MEDKVIVTIDREFGSGGHEVAKRVAEGSRQHRLSGRIHTR